MLVEFIVQEADAGHLAGRLVLKLLPKLTNSRLFSLFRKKEIKVNGRPILRTHRLQSKDRLQVFGLRAEEIPQEGRGEREHAEVGNEAPVPGLAILYEDDELLVLDKPAHQAVHPGSGVPVGGSVIERVHDYLRVDTAWTAAYRPALAHRLDRETSGVLIVAKTAQALQWVHEALRKRKCDKRYFALVHGIPPAAEGRIDTRLQRVDSRLGAKSQVVAEEGKPAVTRYRVLENVGNFRLLEVIIETGRMHQIRAHLASQGLPIAGDSRYGDFALNRQLRRDAGLKRCFLHSHRLTLHPSDRAAREFRSPLPAELTRCLHLIRQTN